MKTKDIKVGSQDFYRLALQAFSATYITFNAMAVAKVLLNNYQARIPPEYQGCFTTSFKLYLEGNHPQLAEYSNTIITVNGSAIGQLI